MISKILLILLVLLSSCTESENTKKLSETVRTKFKTQLKKLPPVNYIKIFGRTPSEAELELGRALFNDTILSRNNDTSCATCHLSNHGFADGNGLPVGSLGIGGPSGDNVGANFGEGTLSLFRHLGEDDQGFRPVRKMFRNSLSTVNVVYRHDKNSDSGLLWDGRFGNLFFQVLLPIHTPEELCGQNPLPITGENPFEKGGRLFKEPIRVEHSHFSNPYTGENKDLFNYQVVYIDGVPRYRENGKISFPSRNECLAIALAKLNASKEYKELFKKAYRKDVITDKLVALALSAFVMTHISNRTPYDKFVMGENALSESELKGMAIFLTPLGEMVDLGEYGKYNGAGCVKCHAPPHFTNNGFNSLRVKSDGDSILTLPQNLGNFSGGFFKRNRSQRGYIAKCHIEGISVLSNIAYAPDIGRANATQKDADCFKFRVPTLRNVIETYPYFHHGTERGQSHKSKTLKERSLSALKNVVGYHLRGPVDTSVVNRIDTTKRFFDKYFQIDSAIPLNIQDFGHDNTLYKDQFKEEEINYIVDFISMGLWDQNSVKIGSLGNDVTHPKRVPSGLSPSITRDKGSQQDY